jgi:hypothetical protein
MSDTSVVSLWRSCQLADPLAIRRFELMRAFRLRFQGFSLVAPPAITLEPDAIHAGRDKSVPDVDGDLPAAARWVTEAVRCIASVIDVLLDAEHIPIDPQPGWAAQFAHFAAFLQRDPTGIEMKRKRTTAKFLADLRVEIAEAAHQSGISQEQMSDWFLNHHGDVDDMEALGLYREVLHEKLCKPKLRWLDNDLTDMMYLTAAAGYCDHLVGERSHVAHLRQGIRRLQRPVNVHTRLTSLMDSL